VLAGCQSTRLKDNNTAKATTVYEAASKALSMGFTNNLILVGSKELEHMWSNKYPHSWKLHPIFEDLHHLKLHNGMQLTIKAVPHIILTDTKNLALTSSHHFVTVFSSSLNLNM
jgi:hypothetical protein